MAITTYTPGSNAYDGVAQTSRGVRGRAEVRFRNVQKR
jgi:hypothetical protein